MQSALMLHVGPFALVSRTPDIDLTPQDWGRIDTASHWLGQGMRDYGAQLLREIEDGHGVTGADRRFAKLTDRGTLVVPGPATARVGTRERALFIEDGKLRRVFVLTAETPHPDSGEPMRSVLFYADCAEDGDGEEYDVKAANLAPCDDLWRLLPLAPDALETGKWAGHPQYAEPHRPGSVSKAPVMEKFDRIAPVKPEDVRLDLARMTSNQRDRLRVAEGKLARAEQRKSLRRRIVAGRVTGYGRMTNEEKTERADYKAEMDRLQQETLAANDRAEVGRGRVETVALEQMRGGAIQTHEDGRLSRKNGLDTLLASHAITKPEHVAGEKYAAIYSEAHEGEIKIANWGGSGGGMAPDPERERLMRLKIAARKKALTDIEAFVIEEASHKRALWALRLVAGEGRLIAHVSTSGGNRATNTKALQMALQALADKWGLQ